RQIPVGIVVADGAVWLDRGVGGALVEEGLVDRGRAARKASVHVPEAQGHVLGDVSVLGILVDFDLLFGERPFWIDEGREDFPFNADQVEGLLGGELSTAATAAISSPMNRALSAASACSSGVHGITP